MRSKLLGAFLAWTLFPLGCSEGERDVQPKPGDDVDLARGADGTDSARDSSAATSGLIQQGIWQLSVDLRHSETGEPLPIPARQVRVRLATGIDSDPEVSVLEISPLHDEESLSPMYGEITAERDGEKPRVSILHTDKDWAYQLLGIVEHSKQVKGTRYRARSKFEDLTLEGEWSLQWLKSE